MVTTCPNCRKEYEVMWPDQWVYKRPNHSGGSNYHYYCSWKCLRASEQKGETKRMGARKLLTDEQKNHAVWLAISGEDPRPYLTECGTRNANAAWSQIRMAVKENDPDTFAKLPRVIGHKKRPKTVTFNGKEYERAPAIETPEGTLAGALQGMQDATNEFFGKCKDMGLKVDDKPIQLPGAPAVTTLPVCAVRSRVDNGMKYKVDKDGLMVLTFDGGFFRFALKEWKSFSEEIITALDQLGVEK